MIYLFDADVYAYRAAVLSEHRLEWDDEVTTHVGDLVEAQGRLRTTIAEDCETLGITPKSIRLVYSSKDNWRKRENPEYKANRKQAKPLVYADLVAWSQRHYQYMSFPGMEADDVLGLLMSRQSGGEYCAVTIDKDLCGVPGWLFNPDKYAEPRKVSLREADEFFWTQCLTGDPTDGYSGARGIGKARAARILEPVLLDGAATIWNEIVKAYESRGQTEAEAVMNARMARIVRCGEWNEEERTSTWFPPEV